MGLLNRIMGFFGLQEEEYIEEVELEREEHAPTKKGRPTGNVVSLHSHRNMQVVLIEPRTYDEAQEIADQLRSRRPVVVNLQRLTKEQARRMVDFLSGTVYAVNGSIQKVGSHIFLCTPDSVDILGTITEMSEDHVDSNLR